MNQIEADTLNCTIAEGLERQGFGAHAWAPAPTCPQGHAAHGTDIGGLCSRCMDQFVRAHREIPDPGNAIAQMLQSPEADQVQWRIGRGPRRFTEGDGVLLVLDVVMRDAFRTGPVASESWHWVPGYEDWRLDVRENGYGGYIPFRGATMTECLARRLAGVVTGKAREND